MNHNDRKALESFFGFVLILVSVVMAAKGIHGWGWITLVGVLCL